MAVFVAGLFGITIFYILILAVGVWIGTKKKNVEDEEFEVVGRTVGFSIGFLTLTATWVGSSFINATSEALFTSGLFWCQIPFGYSLSLIFGTLLFVKPMREANYITILDPFQKKYGERIGSLMFIPAVFGDIVWIASVLSTLGSSLRVILDISATMAVIISTIFAATYTFVGGLYNVTYTDILQIFCIFIGLILCTPFAYYEAPFKKGWVDSSAEWIGEIESKNIGVWIDGLLHLSFGGIPFQAYFQRVLSIKSTKIAQTMGIAAACGCLLIAIPAAFIGIIARNVEWDSVPDFNRTITDSDANIILPLVFKYLTPAWVSFFGLGAVSAAVILSADSTIFTSTSMFFKNIYKLMFRPQASDEESLWVLRGAVVIVFLLSIFASVASNSIYYLAYLCSDLIYVILFPQLLLVIHWPNGVTRYGCLVSYGISIVFRIMSGEKGLGIPAIIHYPWYDDTTNTQLFPFKTFIMLLALLSHIFISCLTRWIFQTGVLSADEWDFLYDFPDCHFMRQDHSVKETRHKEGTKGRSNKAVHDAILNKRSSQASDGYLINNDDEHSVSTKRDRNSITYQTSTTSEEPSISII